MCTMGRPQKNLLQYYVHRRNRRRRAWLQVRVGIAGDLDIAHGTVDGPQSDDLLRPVFMGCATRNAKVVAISLGSLQRLIALKAVPQSAVALIITTMSDAISQGVDIQLRILQTLLSLITNFPAVHGPMLGDVRVQLCSTHIIEQHLCRHCCCASNYKNPK